jgi:hypothetical protein
VVIFNADLVHTLSDWETIDWIDPARAILDDTLSTCNANIFTVFDVCILEAFVSGGTPGCCDGVALGGGTFAVRRKAILAHWKEFYRRCLEEFAHAGQNVSDPEISHFTERSRLVV